LPELPQFWREPHQLVSAHVEVNKALNPADIGRKFSKSEAGEIDLCGAYFICLLDLTMCLFSAHVLSDSL
jgi:hypothetical protein